MSRTDDDVLHEPPGEPGRPRCFWCAGHADLVPYHDAEWGRPVTDERRLFEKLCLEGFQSGLSWLTILRKRPHFRAAFADFDAAVVAGYGPADVERLLGDAGIVRHRKKIEAAIHNARAAVRLRDEAGGLAPLVWSFEPDPASRPARMTKAALMTMAQTPESQALAKELKRRGFIFVGPTTAYAFMQAMGLVNDHQHGCTVRAAAEAERARFVRPAR